MRIFITGATGLIGRRLVLDRLGRGDRLVLLSRRPAHARATFAADANPNVEVIDGDPSEPGPWQKALDGCDAVVHLAGAGVADRRWTPEYKRTIVNSRIDSTHQIVEALTAAAQRPRVFVSGSAVGIYGPTGAIETDESAQGPPHDFFVDLCRRWEEEAVRAEGLGVRVVRVRTGIVLDNRGGALAKLIPPFKMFVGGPIGLGRAYMPWIHWRDLIGIIDLALRQDALHGAVNGTAPEPVPNRVFCRALGRALGRPSWLPVPPPVLRIVLGEMAKYVLMSQRIVPRVARAAGYRFIYPNIDTAMNALLGSGAASVPAVDDGIAAAASANIAPPAPVRLLAIGADGTLLGSNSLPQRVVRAVRAARRDGCVVVLATARPPRFMRGLVSALELTGPTIHYHGALIWNPVDERPQYHEPLDPETGRAVVAAARAADPNVLVGVEILDRWYTDRLPTGTTSANEPDEVGALEDFLGQAVTQIDLVMSLETTFAVRAAIEPMWRDGRIALFQPGRQRLQITSRLVDKGIALQRIARRLELGRESVMAIGATEDDLGMLEWAGFAVAAGGAPASVGAIADLTVAGGEDHGVAAAIERFVLGRT